MSCGSPLAAGTVRQRHSQGDGSGGDDAGGGLEDDTSTLPNSSPRTSSPPPAMVISRPRSWFEVAVNVVWVGSAVFVIYYGDRKSNLVAILRSDGRIRRYFVRVMEPPQDEVRSIATKWFRTPLCIGLASGFLNVGLILYTSVLQRSLQKSSDEFEAFLSTAPLAVALGFLSFCLISYSLWPIWGILTILLMITMFMSSLVILSCLMRGPFEPELLRVARVVS